MNHPKLYSIESLVYGEMSKIAEMEKEALDMKSIKYPFQRNVNRTKRLLRGGKEKIKKILPRRRKDIIEINSARGPLPNIPVPPGRELMVIPQPETLLGKIGRNTKAAVKNPYVQLAAALMAAGGAGVGGYALANKK